MKKYLYIFMLILLTSCAHTDNREEIWIEEVSTGNQAVANNVEELWINSSNIGDISISEEWELSN